jgi:hypothetical protein
VGIAINVCILTIQDRQFRGVFYIGGGGGGGGGVHRAKHPNKKSNSENWHFSKVFPFLKSN